jgi:pyridoxal phosphate enzyme (YggS family)
LVAATKTVEPDRLREAYAAGVREFGENRVQEAEAKVAVLRDLSITWHMIGHVQTNKARAVSELFDWVHSVDSLRVAEKLSSARDGQKKVPVLIEVNLGGEGTKSGAQETEAARLAESLSRLSGLSLRGLMAVPPFFNDCEMARPYFRRLRRLAQQIESLRLPGVAMTELSMGMSQDFEIAIEEGSTIIRVGTAIFGPRS